MNSNLFNELNKLSFCKIKAPKSLAREWVDEVFNHFAFKMKEIIKIIGVNEVLFTRGGTFNTYLMSLISEVLDVGIIIPEKEIVDYKEALIFAFLGVLSAEDKNNCLSSVTGAIKDNCEGSVFVR